MATATSGASGPGRGGGGGGGVRTTNRYSALQSLIADQDDIEDELAHGQSSVLRPPGKRESPFRPLSFVVGQRAGQYSLDERGRACHSGLCSLLNRGALRKRSLTPCSVPACSPETTPRPQVSHLGPVQEELCPREGRPLPRRQDRPPHSKRE